MHGNKSKGKLVETAVPQGSVLGLILFSLFFNDYPLSLTHTQAALYADDTALLIAHHSLQEAELLVNNELQVTSKWFKRNKLAINTKTTK